MFQSTPRKITWQMCRNSVAIGMAAPLKSLLIDLKVVALEKVAFSNREIPKTVC